MSGVTPTLPRLISWLFVLLTLGCAAEAPPLDTVATSDLIVHGRVTIYEEHDELGIGFLLNTMVWDEEVDVATMKLKTELQVLQADGTYKHIDAAYDYNLPDPNYKFAEVIPLSFLLKGYKAGMNYRVMIFRANGEEVELMKVDVKTKFRSTYSTEILSYANNDTLDFSFAFENLESTFDFSGFMSLYVQTDCGGDRNYISIDENDINKVYEFPYKLTLQTLFPDGISSEIFPCTANLNNGHEGLHPDPSASTIATEVGSSLQNAGDSMSVKIFPTPAVFTITE